MQRRDGTSRPPVDHHWFVPKAFGWGATPATWQGWALTPGFTAALVLVVTRVPTAGMRMAAATVLIVGFASVALAKTAGGWQWRWGGRIGR